MSTNAIRQGAAGAWVPDDKSFGARLALVRQHMGWNAKEAALACGLPAQSWRNWEAGGRCRDQEAAARQISARVGCDYLWLFTGEIIPTQVETPASVSDTQSLTAHTGEHMYT